MKQLLNKCNLCPRECNVNRNKGELGYCKANSNIKIAKVQLHYGEEPCLSKERGSGTIFFSHCNLNCLYCQNYKISNLGYGIEVTIERFSDICLELQKKGALNINLVTPSHYASLLVEGLKLAKEKGLSIPIIYNTSSYEKKETIELLNGLIDIYLPDLKYYSDDISVKYSNCFNYFKYATSAIEEMYRQVGKPIIKDGLMLKGMIVRHLVLPSNIEDSKKIIDYLYKKYKNNIIFSIMNQYTCLKKLKYSELNRKVTEEEYYEVVNYAYDLGIRKAFIQDETAIGECFIPMFDGEGVIKKDN